MKFSRHGLGLVGLCLTIVALSLVSLSGFAQQSPAPAGGQLQVRTAPPSDAKDLTLDVVVTGKSGKAVAGLKETDFTVLDNGHPQKVLAFRASTKPVGSDTAAGDPVKLILLVDEVNTNFDRVSYERDQIKKFLLQNGGVLPYPTSMAFFMDTKTEIQKTTSRDGNGLLAVFDEHQTALRTIRRSQGFYGAIERLQASLNTLHLLAQSEVQTPGRKIVIWISPGWPLLSGPGVEISDKDDAKLFGMVISLSTELREARVTLYSVDPMGAEASVESGTYYRQFLKPVTAKKNVLPGNLALQVIATQTGGLVLSASNDITDQINRCLADADAYYTLTIEAQAVERPNEYHSIDVKVATPGLTARTRNGYYAQP